jgi:membrane-associated phospholipid phosphatase
MIARVISSLSSPYLTAPLFILLAGYYYVQDPFQIALYGSITVGFTVLIPLLYTLHLRRIGSVDSLHIIDQRSRLGPLAITGASSAVGLALLYAVGAPEEILRLAVLLFLLAATVLVATFFLKVSGHMAAWGAGTTIVVALYGPVLVPLFLIALPIAWSRLTLERHTPLEVVAGFIYGIGTAAIIAWLLDLW